MTYDVIKVRIDFTVSFQPWCSLIKAKVGNIANDMENTMPQKSTLAEYPSPRLVYFEFDFSCRTCRLLEIFDFISIEVTSQNVKARKCLREDQHSMNLFQL